VLGTATAFVACVYADTDLIARGKMYFFNRLRKTHEVKTE